MGDVFAALPDIELPPDGDAFSSPMPLGPEGQVLHGTLDNGMQ